MTTGVIYIGADNVVTLHLKDGGQGVDLAAMTKLEITIDGLTKNSVDDPALFVLEEDDLAIGKVGLKFGALSELTEDDYPITVRVYDSVNTNGIVWAHIDNKVKTNLRVIRD